MVEFVLSDLPYAYDALEPHIDEETLKIHHGKHHQTYCDKFNAAVKEAGIETNDVIEIFKNISKYPTAVRNHGGGFWNHSFHWESMSHSCDGPDKLVEIRDAIDKSFGSFDNFREEFSKKAALLFGSGWTWLGIRSDGSLVIFNTINQDNSYMDIVQENAVPLLVIDVWEHAYYLKYKNKRAEYIKNFFNVINWNKVNERLKDALGSRETSSDFEK